MGDAQSAQRESRSDAAEEEEEEEGGSVEDARPDGNTDDKPLKKSGGIAEINGKTDSTITEVNYDREDEIAADDILSPDNAVSVTATQLKEGGTPLEDLEINDKEPPNESDANEGVPLEMTELDEKQNEINEGFKRFFSNISLKLTVKRGSVVKDEITTDVSDEINIEDTAKEPKSANAEQNIDLNAQEAIDNDSTACPVLRDVTSHDILENAEEKTPEAEEEVEPRNVDTATGPPVVEDEKARQDAIEEDLNPESPSSPEAEEVVSPVKRFFTTGIFSGLRKKKKPTGDETAEKELVDMGGKDSVETTEIQQEVQQDVDTATVDTKHKENGRKEEILSAASDQTTDDGKSPSTNPVAISINEPEIASSQDKVQDSPLKWLLSGPNLKKLSKKQKGRKSSNTTLSDTEEQCSEPIVSPSKSAETQKEERLAQQLAEATGEEEGAWASFKKLVTPKKQMKKSSLTNEETQIPGSEEETKASKREQISDHSTEERKRKDSSVSWEAVLCGSGRRRSRSRKTSDSEDESPQFENDNKKQELPLESSNEADETLALSPRQPGSPEGDVGSTWKSFKKLVTPKRKAKDEEESKDNNAQSDSEVTRDDSSFSIKKLLPGRKKRKSAENQDQVSSDEADKEVDSGDEDSETPAVIPLSEFDTIETKVMVDVESHVTKEADHQLQQDLHDQVAEPVLPCDSVQTETKKVQDSKDTIKKEVSTAPVSNEEPEDLTEIISKHQQLSDIPEEGFITETNVSEEAARDDTIAEDLIEITSEAVTAPEPADTTLADETEMISAVSQLSESSNTSGNATPVPVDNDVKHTEVLLHQVVENISISPNVEPVCSDEVNSERIVGSVSPQILETFVKEKPTILEIHRKSDAIAINKDLTVEELDTINELTVPAQTESISEVNKAVSIEIVSEVPENEAVTAEISADEVYQVNISHPEESIKELGSADDSQHLVKGQPEANEAGSTQTLPEGEAIVADQGSQVGTHQDEKEPIAINSQEAEFTATVAEENQDGGAEEDAQTLTQKEEQILHNITEEVKGLQELPGVQHVIYDSEEGSSQLLEIKVISENIPAEETVPDKLNEETEPVMEYTVEAEMENKLQADDAPTEHAEEPEVLETVQIATLDLEDGSAKSLERDVVSEVIPAEETAIDKPKGETDPLTDCKVEAENENILQADSTQTEHAEEPEVLEAAQTATLDSEEGTAHFLEKEVISEVTQAEETATDNLKEETEPVTEYNVEADDGTKLQADSAPTELAEEPEVLEAVQTTTLDLEESSAQLLEKEVISEVIPAEEMATDKPKEETEPVNEYNVETENENKLQADDAQTEHTEEPEVLEAAQIATLDSEGGTAQLLEKEVISEVIPADETVTDNPNEETEPPTEHNVEAEDGTKLQADSAPTELAEEPEVLEVVQTTTLDLEKGTAQLLEKEVITEVIPAGETATDKAKEETEPPTEHNVEADDGTKLQADAAQTEHAEEPEVLDAAQTSTLDSEEGRIQIFEKEVVTEVIPVEETVTDNPKEETEPVTEYNVEAEDGTKLQADSAPTELAEEPEVLEAVQTATLDLVEGTAQLLEKEVIPAGETATDKSKEETDPQTECKDEAENENKLQVDAAQTEEPEVLEGAQIATLDSVEGRIQIFEKEVVTEVIPVEETVTDKPNEETERPTEHAEEPEVLEAAQTATLDSEGGTAQLLEKEVISEVIPADETVTDNTKEETEPPTEHNFEAEDGTKLQADSAPTELAEEPEVLEAVQTATLDLEKGSAQLLEKEVITEVIPAGETAIDKAKEETEPQTECKVEAENENKLQADAAQTEHCEEPEVLEAAQTSTLDSEEGRIQIFEKEVVTEVSPVEETVTDKPNEETERPTEHNVEAEMENKLQADAAQTEHAEEPEVLEAAQTSTLDSEGGTAQLLENEVISEVIPADKTVTDNPKEETEPVNECNVEAEMENKLQVDAAQTEHAEKPEVLEAVKTLDSREGTIQMCEKEVITEVIPVEETVTDKPNEQPEVLEAVQTATLGIEKNGVQSPQGEVSENILAAETVTDGTKQATENLVGVSSEPEHQELKTDIPNNDHHNVAEVLGTVQEPTSESEEGSVKSLETISEATGDAETVTDEPNEETVPLTEVGESVDALETEHVQEPEVFQDAQVAMLDSEEASARSLEKKVISEEIPPAETVQEPKTELSAEDAKTEHVPADVNDIATGTETEVEAPMPTHVLTQRSEEGSAEKLEKKVLFEDVPNPDTQNVIASVTVVTDHRVVAELNQALRRNEVQETESTLFEHTDEANSFQVRERTVFSEVTPAPCVECAAVTHEPLHELHLSAVESSVGEERGEIPGFEIKRSAVEHAIVAQVITCCLKDVAATLPDALIETTSDSHEPLIDSMANEQEFKETSETTAPLEKKHVTERGEECSVVMMMNMPSVQSEDNHRIQVQVVNVDIKSAKMTVDTALEVGVTEAKAVMEACRETVKEVDVLSATSETEETFINEANKVAIQEVIQHEKENLPERVPESATANLEREVIKEMVAVTELSEITRSELSEVEDHKATEDNVVTCREGQDEKHAVECDASTSGQQVFKDLMETPIRLDVSIHDPKEDLEEPKAEVEKSEARVTTEEVQLSSDVKTIGEKAQTPQIAQSLVVTPNTGLIVPQNTGIISSIGNLESPSSLSLEFKLNIRFGHTKEPASAPPPPPPTERVEPVKQTDVAEVGMQAGEPTEEINPTQRAGRQNQELTEVTAQGTEITQPAEVASTERPMTINQPVLLDVGMQTVETVEPAEQLKSTERGTPNVQAAETVQRERREERKEMSLSPAILCEVCDPGTEAEEPLKRTEEENDQDVWMDAEEDIYSHEDAEVSLREAVVDEEEAAVQHEFEVAPDSRIEEGGSHQGVLKTDRAREIESDGEDFAVALEDPAIAAASVTAMEWD
ncbi:putative A-kinase anchor protein 12-like [Scophthalmus maximus]|uniref:Putative A-kinase anchor protein 12-like n=1 Tax=Scophthalmus maximus TaxID=52904 RepID=A0A2U9CKF7_SCOMX|nr:putative A-kinase anchor protein 12-like [Scophthalmus maximus]